MKPFMAGLCLILLTLAVQAAAGEPEWRLPPERMPVASAAERLARRAREDQSLPRARGDGGGRHAPPSAAPRAPGRARGDEGGACPISTG